jgi:glycine/D-amino acid oxidase-like deaminating enzyme
VDADIAIVGAGIAGVYTAFNLIVIDDRDPFAHGFSLV